MNATLRFWDSEWEHFRLVDIADEAPPVQVMEMRKAFYAGLASGVKLGALYGAPANLAAMDDHLARENARRAQSEEV
jgi:hypothetical protein